MITILTGVKWYLIVVLICISLIASDACRFSYVSGPFVCPPWRSVWSFPFFNWVFGVPRVRLCESFIYFEGQTLSWDIMANKFSHTVGSLFILLIFSLAMQNLFILMRSHFLILSFISPALGIYLWKYCFLEYLRFHACFLLKDFYSVQLIFKSFIHLQFIFVYGISSWLNFIFLQVAVQLSQHDFWRGYFYSILCCWVKY